ncbi:hypothetical protein BDV95DRAFT_586414 [Massariosphaeria phaeospora]|uniref:DUF7730 domain-containing protein n=1 Tax=Massariosphaeria phaeospora TaxID=100035 RepID=A0A7C8M723_9PLEO|nr:hypothetical protein BDV95DRAFT_586414 [Massariosphaeria phaeospora]
MPKAAPKKRAKAKPPKARVAKAAPSEVNLVEEASVEDLIGQDDITLHNAQNSSLLRLPAELREQIWTYAFGNRTLHPDSSRKFYGHPGRGTLTFYRCQEPHSDAEVYAMSLQGSAPDAPYSWAAESMVQDDRWVGSHGTRCLMQKAENATAPAVCKQMYHEAEEIIWKTTTWSFASPFAFQDFVRTPGVKLHLITQLSIVLDHRGLHGWENALTPGTVASCTSLVGLNLIMSISRWYMVNSRSYSRHIKRMNRPQSDTWYLVQLISQFHHLVNLIKQFQHLPLREERTTVLVTHEHGPKIHDPPPADPGPRLSVPKRIHMAGIVKELLLDHHPRRLSGRSRR